MTKEISKSDLLIKGNFNHSYINWSSLHCTGTEDQICMHLTQDVFLKQHDLQPTKENRTLNITFSTPPELVDCGEKYEHLIVIIPRHLLISNGDE